MKYFILLISLAFLSSCDDYFGKKTDLSFIDKPEYQNREIAYVPIQPAWRGFTDPVDVAPGFDEMIYVVDQGSSEIISFDVAGNETGRIMVPGVKSVIQDRRLDLLAVGTFDTTISGNTYSLSTIYRINLKQVVYGLNNAKITHKTVHPFYYKASFTNSDADVQFNEVAITGDNSYYVTRSGPRNFTTQTGGPDDAVLVFNSNDKYITPVTVSTSMGTFSNYFKKPYSITTLAQPPQTYGITDSKDFIVTMTDPDVSLKVVYISYFESAFGASYEVRQLISGDSTLADGYLYDPGKFNTPVGVTYAGDVSNYIFVADLGSDSVLQFTSSGYEGVKPPPGSASSKYIKASFGGQGQSLSSFNNPSAVGYFRRILYVADRGNKRILRFKLTSDFD